MSKEQYNILKSLFKSHAAFALTWFEARIEHNELPQWAYTKSARYCVENVKEWHPTTGLKNY